MKRIINGLAIVAGLLLALIAIISATPRDTLIANTSSYLPPWLPFALSSRWTLFVVTAVMFAYAGYRTALWLRRHDKRIAREQGFEEGQAQGLIDGEAKALAARPEPNMIQKLLDDAAPARQKAAEEKTTADQLIYHVREVIGALSAPGILKEETVGRSMAVLKRERPIWHITANYNLRKSFIDVVEKAVAARIKDGNAAYVITADYKPEEREHHVKSLQNCGDKLIGHLGSRASRERENAIK
jgi:hypothetical protein